MEAKVGDYVKCINNYDAPLTLGKYYKIITITYFNYEKDICYHVIHDKGVKFGFYKWRFEYDICSNRKYKLLNIEKLCG
jgi:hypothetical protein